MDLDGNRFIACSRQSVWQALNEAEVLHACIPGCSELTGNAQDGFDAVVTQKVGPVKATFKGRIKLTDITEAESYRIVGEGKGGAAGFAKGSAFVKLEDVEGGTNLSYVVDARVGGKLAQIGSRVVHGVAVKIADLFFMNFEAIVTSTNEVKLEEVEEEKPERGWVGNLLDWLKKLKK